MEHIYRQVNLIMSYLTNLEATKTSVYFINLFTVDSYFDNHLLQMMAGVPKSIFRSYSILKNLTPSSP